jgi:hypothetical protein
MNKKTYDEWNGCDQRLIVIYSRIGADKKLLVSGRKLPISLLPK